MTTLVRRHVRHTEAGRLVPVIAHSRRSHHERTPITVALYPNWEKEEPGYSAHVVSNQPNKIVIVRPRQENLTPRDVGRLLSHETLHSVLFRLGELDSSDAIDALRAEHTYREKDQIPRPIRRRVAPTGLYYYSRFRRRTRSGRDR